MHLAVSSKIPDSEKHFPLLAAVVKSVTENENVKAYLAKRPQTQF
jgi:hypothetical protein